MRMLLENATIDGWIIAPVIVLKESLKVYPVKPTDPCHAMPLHAMPSYTIEMIS